MLPKLYPPSGGTTPSCCIWPRASLSPQCSTACVEEFQGQLDARLTAHVEELAESLRQVVRGVPERDLEKRARALRGVALGALVDRRAAPELTREQLRAYRGIRLEPKKGRIPTGLSTGSFLRNVYRNAWETVLLKGGVVTEGSREQEGGGTGRRTLRSVARVAGWLIVPMYVTSLCSSYFLTYSVESWSSSSLLDNVQGVMLDLGFGAFALVGALLVARRPANSIG
jgi:hypothetical protein